MAGAPQWYNVGSCREASRNTGMIEVVVLPNESIDSALKRFDNKLQQTGILRRLKEHSYYEKPSDKRRRMKRRSGRRTTR